MKTTTDSTRIAILIRTDYGFGREVIRGIMSFARTQPTWIIRRESPKASIVPWLLQWKPHGLISHIEDTELLEALRPFQSLWIDLTTRYPGDEAPPIWQDDRKVGQIAAEYFFAKGYRHFAYVGFRVHKYSIERQMGMEAAAKKLGGKCELFLREELPAAPTAKRDWTTDRSQLVAWLLSLPKPVGILACHDVAGAEIIEACQECGLSVPEQVAVMGVEDDDLLCFTTQPHLSSVRMPNESIGFHTAEHMHRVITGKKPRRITLPPIGVITRGSSDLVATEDRVVSAALKFIHAHLHEPIRVESVLENVTVSQSVLERRFREVLGRTPLAEIRRLRIERAKLLLADTNLPMSRIAEQCGFNSTVRFSMVFHELAGVTPTGYREAMSPGMPKNSRRKT